MHKKSAWATITTILLPYLVLFALALIFLSGDIRIFEWIMEYVFWGNGLLLIAVLLLYCVFVGILNVTCLLSHMRQRKDALLLAKTAVKIKLLQIPAYILIFILGVVMIITIFTIPFSIGLFLFDCVCLCMSGLWTVCAAVQAMRQGICKPQEAFLFIALQFIFCVDVISSIVFYILLKKRRQINAEA